MSLPKKQRSKIKKLCKQYGIELKIINQDLEEYFVDFIVYRLYFSLFLQKIN